MVPMWVSAPLYLMPETCCLRTPHSALRIKGITSILYMSKKMNCYGAVSTFKENRPYILILGTNLFCLFAVVIGVVLALACSPFIFTIPALTPTAMWVSAPLCLMSEAHVHERANGTRDKGIYFRALQMAKK